jgi:hypothetical protein
VRQGKAREESYGGVEEKGQFVRSRCTSVSL